MNRVLSMMLVGALFVVGVLIGVLGERALDRRAGGDGPPRFRGQGGFAEMLDRRLELTEDQRDAVARILDESHGEAEAMRLEMEPRVREHMERTRDRLREVLTPEQQTAFEEMHRRGGMERGFLGGGGRPHRGGPPSHRPRPPDAP